MDKLNVIKLASDMIQNKVSANFSDSAKKFRSFKTGFY